MIPPDPSSPPPARNSVRVLLKTPPWHALFFLPLRWPVLCALLSFSGSPPLAPRCLDYVPPPHGLPAGRGLLGLRRSRLVPTAPASLTPSRPPSGTMRSARAPWTSCSPTLIRSFPSRRRTRRRTMRRRIRGSAAGRCSPSSPRPSTTARASTRRWLGASGCFFPPTCPTGSPSAVG